MEEAKVLGSILNQVDPLIQTTKAQKAALLEQLLSRPDGEQHVECDGRIYKVRHPGNRTPGLSMKLFNEMVTQYNRKKHIDPVSDDFVDFVVRKQNKKRKPSKPSLSISVVKSKEASEADVEAQSPMEPLVFHDTKADQSIEDTAGLNHVNKKRKFQEGATEPQAPVIKQSRVEAQADANIDGQVEADGNSGSDSDDVQDDVAP